ncbi:MAG TPA: sulfite exporter TauE/SafE family protein [Candidatus Lokiarchaeia archaeon]|nr:sulfite exporter TauE/SafE family protein [Candidatus Lokiarchaeia archaeon]
MDMILELVLGIGLGFAVGIYASMTGTGGGSLYGPIFESIMFVGLPNSVTLAIGTSLFVVFINSISTSFAYFKQKRIDYRTSLYLIIFSTPFAILGSYMTDIVSSFKQGQSIMKIIFYAFILFIGWYMLVKKSGNVQAKMAQLGDSWWVFNHKLVDCDGVCFEYKFNIIKIIPWAMLAGFLSGFLGIGGGMIMVPAFSIICCMPLHVVVATSGFMLLFNSAVSTTFKFIINDVDPVVGLIFAAGSIFGAQLGAKIAKGTQSKLLKNIISVCLIVLSIYKLYTITYLVSYSGLILGVSGTLISTVVLIYLLVHFSRDKPHG